MSTEGPGPGPRVAGPAPRRKERGAAARRRGGLGAFLLAGALPVAALAWFFLQPAAAREDLLAKVPAGWTGRAIHAAIAFGALFVLAQVALPAFHGAAGSLGALSAWLRAQRGARRVLLFPLEALVGLLRVLVQALYAVDAALILAAALVLLLLVVRIVKPGVLPDVLPHLGR